MSSSSRLLHNSNTGPPSSSSSSSSSSSKAVSKQSPVVSNDDELGDRQGIPQSGRRKRKIVVADANIDDEDSDVLSDADEAPDGFPVIFREPPTKNYIPNSRELTVSNKINNQFERLSREARDNCIKAIYRLVIFKGGRKEPISRKVISDELAKLDPAYKSFVSIVVNRVRAALSDGCTGYVLVGGDEVLAASGYEGKKDEFYLVNGLSSSRLQQALAGAKLQGGGHPAENTFFLMVFFAILTSPGQRISFDQLLQQLHQVDSRFPQTLDHKHHTAAASAVAKVAGNLALPELGDDVVGLLARMKKEHYLNCEKDVQDAQDAGKQIFTFGTRFYLEIGKLRLAKAYYTLMGGGHEDEAILKEFQEERDRFQEDRQDSSSDEGSEDG